MSAPLIPCPSCHRQISNQARSCPHCGLPQARTNPLVLGCLWVALGCFAFIILAVIWSKIADALGIDIPSGEGRSASTRSVQSGYVSSSGRINPGVVLYQAGKRVGTVKDVKSGDPSTGETRDMVLIEFDGAGTEWKARDTVKQFFQVRADDPALR